MFLIIDDSSSLVAKESPNEGNSDKVGEEVVAEDEGDGGVVSLSLSLPLLMLLLMLLLPLDCFAMAVLS